MNEDGLNWISANEAKKYSFNADKTVFVFSNVAKSCSRAAQKWYQQQKISVYFYVDNNKFDHTILQLLKLPKGTEKIKIYCRRDLLIDISQFSKDLKELAETNVNKTLSDNIQPAITKTEPDDTHYTRKDLRQGCIMNTF